MPSIATQLDQLNNLLPTLPQHYQHLILVAGRHGAGKTRLLKELSRRADGAITYLNLNLALSGRLLDLTSRVAFHIQRGFSVPLNAAEYYAGLRQRFPERDGMYFLPAQAAEYDRRRLRVRKVE